MQFTKAVRRKAKLRLALSGPSGSGKTLSALLLASGIGGKIAVIDTERESASLYVGGVQTAVGARVSTPDFDALNLSAPYSPERYREAMTSASSAGYNVLIIDSITHEWSGVGGCLEIVDDIAKARYRGNSWSAWNDVTPRHRALLDAILQSSMHVIVTLRSKTETAQQDGQNGKKQVVKLGMKAEQRDGFEYEMTTVLDLSHDGHFATATKDRTGLFMGRDPIVITPETGKRILDWLESGSDAHTHEPPLTMPETDIKAHLAVMGRAPSSEALRSAFGAAYKAAKSIGDAAAETKLKEFYDIRKQILVGDEYEAQDRKDWGQE